MCNSCLSSFKKADDLILNILKNKFSLVDSYTHDTDVVLNFEKSINDNIVDYVITINKLYNQHADCKVNVSLVINDELIDQRSFSENIYVY